MTVTSGPRDNCAKTVQNFLVLYRRHVELQAIKLAQFYGIDFHELLSRTTVSVWEKWSSTLSVLEDNEVYSYTLRILVNHARNLSKGRRRDLSRCDLLPCQELEALATVSATWRDPAIDAIFRDEELAIFRAISMLEGRCKDVMVLVALGFERHEIRRELGMTVSNLTSTLSRARKLLREILRMGEICEGGGLR